MGTKNSSFKGSCWLTSTNLIICSNWRLECLTAEPTLPVDSYRIGNLGSDGFHHLHIDNDLALLVAGNRDVLRVCTNIAIQLRYQHRLVHGIVLFFLLQSFARRLARSLAKKTVFQDLLLDAGTRPPGYLEDNPRNRN